jgi:hypothetical protein
MSTAYPSSDAADHHDDQNDSSSQAAVPLHVAPGDVDIPAKSFHIFM